ncbi:DUF3107 family protein [Nakamurella sp. YIM 132087]|uniref:DUF3107 family protein n=1 Tax=Nakamurella alba TaxID=2665158 RepID=A0A7K1FJP6_9ACTN|nr:DUF3107 domain-containing protein [Nakamurella alba]MTD13659.1 DUF3107 family protein [Nakamurella alba]
MDIKIGVTDSGRELVVASTAQPEEIEKQVAEALEKSTNLVLVDEKGRRVIVPAARITYVEIAPSDTRRVGFGSA